MAQPDTHDKHLTFLEHLEELRTRLIRALLALSLGVVIGWFLSPYVLKILVMPLNQAGELMRESTPPPMLGLEVGEDGLLRVRNHDALTTGSLVPDAVALYRPGSEVPLKVWGEQGRTPTLAYLRPMDPFVIRLKASLVVGVILSLPVILFQIWAFIAPGLLPKERRLALPLIFAGSVLFPIGAMFAYFLLVFAFVFLWQVGLDNTAMIQDAQAYFSFVLTMMAAFGAVFELPLGIVLATRVGIVTVDWLASRRSYIFIALLVIAAIITPTGDPITLLAMALPLQILFEIALVVSRVLDRMGQRDRERDSAAEGED